MTAAVRFEQVTKRYLRGGAQYQSLRSELAGALRRVATRRRLEPHGTLALDDVSFAVEQGQTYALLGPNGAGKSTALKLVSRISYPTGGRVRVRGRVGALLEVGSGTHPELTGRENIWLYGQILGMPKSEIRRRFEEIVEFAELGHVLDTQVKLYSSGMALRLGFSVASHLDPDVFVVDEALTVGDAGFQVKCVERMTKLVREGRTLLFVSHDLQAVEALCERALLLVEGRALFDGSAREALHRYFEWTEERRRSHAPSLPDPSSSRGLRVVGASCHALDGSERYDFAVGEGLEVRLRFRSDTPLERPHVNLGISEGGSSRPFTHCSMLHDGQAPARVGTDWEVRCRIPEPALRPRLYSVYCDVAGPEGYGMLFDWAELTSFRVTGRDGIGPLGLAHRSTSGPVVLDYAWEVDPGEA